MTLPAAIPSPRARYRKLGLVGGVAWPSTVDIYRAVCQMAQAHHDTLPADGRGGPAVMPEWVIESVDVNQSFHRRGREGDESSWAAYEAYFGEALARLQAAGAEFGLIASNTPHNRFDGITRGLQMPVLNIFDEVAAHCAKAGLRHVLVLGTAPTLAAPHFPRKLAALGITAHVPPDEAARAQLFQMILDLQAGTAQDARHHMARLADSAWADLGLAGEEGLGVALSCTELPLAFDEAERGLPAFDWGGHTWINTTMVLAKAAFTRALKG